MSDGKHDEWAKDVAARVQARREIEAEFGDLRCIPWRPQPRNSATRRGDVLWVDAEHPVAYTRHSFSVPWPLACYVVIERIRATVTPAETTRIIIHPRDTSTN